MALVIITEDQAKAGGTFTPGRRLWLTADRARVVEDGHADAAFLYCAVGQSVPMAEALKFGLVATAEEPPQLESVDAPKVLTKPADKALKKPKGK